MNDKSFLPLVVIRGIKYMVHIGGKNGFKINFTDNAYSLTVYHNKIKPLYNQIFYYL